MGRQKNVFVGACMAGMLLGASPSASALEIIRSFFGGTAASNAAGTGTLEDIFNAAADCWEHHIRDEHTVTLSFGWGAQTGGVLGAHSLTGQTGGPTSRETSGSITFDNDGSSVFYMDPTPFDSSEWSTLTTTTGNFGGGTLTSGREYSGASGLAAGRHDLFSIALHEIGHSLGLSFANDAFQEEILSGNFITVTSPRPNAGSIFATTAGSAHLNISSALMYPSFGHSSRKLISDVDILANAEISQFRDLDFSPCAVPEPMTMALSGMCVAAFVRRRVKSNRATKQVA